MSNGIQAAISAAILRILRPLMRVLLRNGVSYRSFAELAKWVCVDVAMKEFALEGRKQSISRVAVLTGLTRKEIARLQALPPPDDSAEEERYNRAARVVAAWVREPVFTDPDGEPRVLPVEGEGGFGELVRRFSGDIPVRAILDELERVGALERLQDGRVRLRVRAYIPQGSDADKLHILGTDVALLIATIDHNLRGGNDAPPRFQRKTLYDNLPGEALPQLRRLSTEKAQAFLQEMDRWLAEHDRDENPRVQGHGRHRAGIGIYYFEEPYVEER